MFKKKIFILAVSGMLAVCAGCFSLYGTFDNSNSTNNRIEELFLNNISQFDEISSVSDNGFENNLESSDSLINSQDSNVSQSSVSENIQQSQLSYDFKENSIEHSKSFSDFQSEEQTNDIRLSSDETNNVVDNTNPEAPETDTKPSSDKNTKFAQEKLDASEDNFAIDGYETNVSYVDAAGVSHICPIAKIVNDNSDWYESDSVAHGWYVVNHNIDYKGEAIECHGDVNLILKDYCKLKIVADKIGTNMAGITVPDNSSFSVYGQTQLNEDSSNKDVLGKLIAIGDDGTSGGAGIGAANEGGKYENTLGDITINGGNIWAIGRKGGAGIGGSCECKGGSSNINIKGGYIKAESHCTAGDSWGFHSSSGAGIGGGEKGNKVNVNIYGGDVNAEAKDDGAGIGGGDEGSANIYIFGGKIRAIGGDDGAGIGSGDGACDSYINISSGNIYAEGKTGGAGIGGGNTFGDTKTYRCAEVHISGGTIEAKSECNTSYEEGGASIGGGIESCGKVYISGGNIKAYSAHRAAGIGGGFHDDDKDLKSIVEISGMPTIDVEKVGGDGSLIGNGYNGNQADVYIDSRYIQVIKDKQFPLSYSSKTNIAELLKSGEKVSISPTNVIQNFEQQDQAYVFTPNEIYCKCVFTNFDVAIIKEIFSNISFHLGTTNEEIELTNLNVDYNVVTFKLCFDINSLIIGDNTIFAIYTHDGMTYTQYFNITADNHIITQDMIDPIPALTLGKDYLDPHPKVRLRGCELHNSVDYTLSWYNNKGVGYGKVIVQGIGRFTGTVEVKFEIRPSGQFEDKVTYFENGQEHTVNARPLNKAYSNCSSKYYYVFGDCTINGPIHLSGDAHIIICDESKLKIDSDNEAPFVYVNDKAKVNLHYQCDKTGITDINYDTKQFKEVQVYRNQEVSFTSYSFFNKEDVSDVRFVWDDTKKDFHAYGVSFYQGYLSYSVMCYEIPEIGNNPFTVYVTTNNNTYEIHGNLQLDPYQISQYNMPTVPDYYFTGEFVCPHPDIWVDCFKLQEGVDYDLQWTNNTEVGTAYVHVIGKGKCAGQATIDYKIKPCLFNILQSTDVYLHQNLKNANFICGSVFEPEKISNVSFNWVNNGEECSVQDLDYGNGYFNYSILIDKNANIGDNLYKISFDYDGEKYVHEAKLHVSQALITSTAVESIADQEYRATSITPVPNIVVDNYALKLNKDFTVTYSDNVNVGYATAHIQGINWFCGNVDVQFKILPNKHESADVVWFYENNKAQTRRAYRVYQFTTELSIPGYHTADQERWYYVNSDTVIDGTINVSGNIHLIVCDGATLKINSGDNRPFNISSNSKLTIHYQQNHTGKIDAGKYPIHNSMNANTLNYGYDAFNNEKVCTKL